VLAIVALSLLVTAPIPRGGWYVSHEGVAPLERVVALGHEVRHGDPYPRWLSAATYGQGSPFPNFYSPLVYLSAGWLHAAGLGPDAALLVVVLAALVAGAVGVLLWVRRWAGEPAGALAAILYLLAPYHLVDLYVRGALAELGALAVLPWLFLSLDVLLEDSDGRRGVLWVASSSAALVATHNLSALMAIPLAAAYVALRAGLGGWGRRLAGRLPPALALGAGLSAFYWLPALVESRSLRQLSVVRGGPYDPSLHFVEPAQWLATGWGFGVSVPGPADTMSFQLGVGTILAFAAALVAAVLPPRPHARAFAVLAAVAAAALLLTTAAAAPAFDALPLLSFVQFPWRFLGPASLFLAAAGSVAATVGPPQVRWSVAAALAVAAAVAGEPHRRIGGAIEPATVGAVQAAPVTRRMGSLTVANEYLPRWVPAAAPRPVASLEPRIASGAGQIVRARRRGTAFELDVEALTPVSVTVPAYYFPGWTAAAGASAVESRPGADGFVELRLPPGTHAVVLEFGTTPIRLSSWALTAAALATVAWLTWRRRRPAAGPP
jgi:hypothetical protein